MANILYRVSTAPTVPGTTSAKAAPLSNLEIDGNFKSLNDDLLLKAPLANPTFTGTVILPSTTSIGNISNIEIDYLNGVTSNIQTQFSGKAPLTGEGTSGTWGISVTGNAGTVTNGLYSTGSYANPTWITGLAENKVLPDQTTHSGKYLSTNGTISAWSTLSVTAANFASQTAKTFLAAPNGIAGVPTFRTIIAADLGSGTANSTTYLKGDLTWGTSTSITNDTTTNASYYPLWATATTGVPTAIYTSSTKLYFNPSTGTLNSTGFNSLSDRNLKDNINTIQNAGDTVKSISGVEFTWKDSDKKSAGVIAQDLEQVLPWLVETSSEGMKSVNYAGLTAYLIETIKRQEERITNLEALINR